MTYEIIRVRDNVTVCVTHCEPFPYPAHILRDMLENGYTILRNGKPWTGKAVHKQASVKVEQMSLSGARQR